MLLWIVKLQALFLTFEVFRMMQASHAVGDIVLTNPWPLAPETPLWPTSDTSLPFPWLDGGSWDSPPRAQSRERGAAADTWLFYHQHTQHFSVLQPNTWNNNLSCLPLLYEMTNYAAFLFNTLKALADIQIKVLAWTRLSAGVGEKYSFPAPGALT